MTANLPKYLDYANHHAGSTAQEITELCAKVLQYGFNSAFVNPCYISLAKKILTDQAKVGTVIAFPLGQETLATKIAASNAAVASGADELDVVPNLGLFLGGEEKNFLSEMHEIVDAARMLGKPVIVKFILEPGYFDNLPTGEAGLPDKQERMQRVALLIKQSGADFVKIGSGMGPRGPSLEDVKIVKEAVGDSIKIKVAGGIETLAQAEAFIAAGVNRIGTSHAIEIVTEANKK